MLEMENGGRDIRQRNKKRVLDYIFRNRKATKQQLVDALDMSLPTVLQNVKELSREGLIATEGYMDSTGGRKAAAITPIPQVRFAVGVEIARQSVTLVLVDLCGDVQRFAQQRFPFAWEDAYFQALDAMIQEFVRESGVSEQRVLGVGFALPGPVSHGQHTITSSITLNAYNAPTAPFAGSVPYPCAFVHDADAAGHSEAHARQDLRSFVYLHLSHLVGGTVVVDGEPFCGVHNRSGEFGHMRLYPHGKTCYCGNDGCADPYLSADVLAQGMENGLSGFFARLEAADPACVQRWHEYLDSLVILVNNLNMVFDNPVVLGGAVGAFLTPWMAEINRRASAINLFADGDYVYPCASGPHAAALGAALMHIDRFFRQYPNR